jgi:hypothetical protein
MRDEQFSSVLNFENKGQLDQLAIDIGRWDAETGELRFESNYQLYQFWL